MKYLKNFEGVKSNIKSNIELRSKLNQLIPGMYVIFTRNKIMDWKTGNKIDILLLSRVIESKIEHDNDIYGNDFTYCVVNFNVLDCITSNNVNSIPTINERLSLKVDEVLKNKLYMTSSLNNAQSKFEEFKIQYSEKWEIEKNIDKFNL